LPGSPGPEIRKQEEERVRPIIGLSTYVEHARWGMHERRAAVLHMSYVEAVQRAGGRVILLPPDDHPDDRILDNLDGLIITGGADVAPERYGAEPHPTTVPRPDRDASEMILLRGAWARDLPVLGICRGMQLMAVAAGGKLHQHLPELLGSERHAALEPPFRDPAEFPLHDVFFAEGTRCYELLGANRKVVSLHHQGVTDPGWLIPTGWSTEDGLIEALEDPDRQFSIGVQWHPEDSETDIITALVDASASASSHEMGLTAAVAVAPR
jgi:putative glutamine amidotransferase